MTATGILARRRSSNVAVEVVLSDGGLVEQHRGADGGRAWIGWPCATREPRWAVIRFDATLRSRSSCILAGPCLTSRLTNTPIRDPIRCTTWTGRHENSLLSATGGHSMSPAGRGSNDS